MNQAFLSLGSNLDHPIQHVRSAIHELSLDPSIQLMAQSSLYQTKPIGLLNQSDFINAAVWIHTQYPPLELLDACQHIELIHQRKRSTRWGPRTLDIDVLLYDKQSLETKELQIPHPRMLERNFVLVPLLEIVPDLDLPDGTKLVTYLKENSLTDVIALESE